MAQNGGSRQPGRAAVRLHGVTKRFGAVLANDGVDLDIPAGTVHGIIGENGAGKSTLASIVYGLYAPDRGSVEIDGRPASLRSPADAIRLGVGMVHQHFMLVPTFTVLENVMLGAEGGFRLRSGEADIRARLEGLSRAHGLEVDPDALVDELPVGLRQRVEILKALFRGARILILDEPTGVLTPDETDRLFVILRAIRDAGGTVVLITHKLREVMAVCDMVSVMRHGRLAGHRSTAETTTGELAELMVGRKVGQTVRPPESGAGTPVLRAAGLTWKHPGGAPRLKDVSLELRAGEILAVAGVSGNGQSELLDVLSGLADVQEGHVEFAGRRIDAAHPATPAELRALGLAHVPEDRQRRGLVLPFETRENAVLGRPESAGPGPWTSGAAMQAHAEPLIARFDIRPPEPRLPAAGFSGGNQQKIVLAREFESVPAVLLLGQPTRGVDIGTIETIHAEVMALKEQGSAILLVSTELDEILALADRIMVMNAGRVAGTVPAEGATARQLGLMMTGASEEAGA
ncbi:MAG: ABC transporter ATP-binding protein [Alphaproteobacteria bacterium]|nr:ABC transporter ATP-binding protein [Alphaproteobacteria bacterium]